MAASGLRADHNHYAAPISGPLDVFFSSPSFLTLFFLGSSQASLAALIPDKLHFLTTAQRLIISLFCPAVGGYRERCAGFVFGATADIVFALADANGPLEAVKKRKGRLSERSSARKGAEERWWWWGGGSL